MSKNTKDIKPFYIYTNKNRLYIKNINENTEKLSNNIYAYCANIDNQKKIHICAIDYLGKLIHFSNNKGFWKKCSVCKAFNNIKNIKEMRLFIINNFLNIFVVEECSIDEDLYRISHFNFSFNNYKVNKFYINNVVKDKEQIYKINIDDLSNIIFEYKPVQFNNRNESENVRIVFNSNSRTWLSPNTLLRIKNYNSLDTICEETNIKSDIFEFCYSLDYKL
ncbi:hypothetical protein HF520_02665 [Romboutsia sp. CE17]|uniref:hypothetical protein n=1 Tax=Romboutsia sp. CE17 TaxID=2724150 RepID=UPI001442E5FC|nr:hypothetical protein [Romboutsia sp. CE17]QJA07908.1 hypothetical protein HF520_02665 [Romboutsia sp. CE17]